MTVEKNIKKLYVANFLTGVVFWYGIEKLFMQEIGINPLGVGVNAAILLTIIVVFDIPSGVLADRWKRKYTLMLALSCLGLSSFVLGVSNGLAVYLAGTVLYGGYIVLTSGTYQAIMYDSLHEIGKQKHYDRHQGRAYALFLLGVAISSLAGGYISELYGYRWTYYLTVLFSFLAFGVLWTLKEPRFHKLESDGKLIEHVRTSYKSMVSSPLVFQLALFTVVAGILRSTQNEFAGLYYIALGLTAIPTGYANAAKWFSGAFGQYIAEKIGRKALRLIPLFFLSFFVFTLLESLWGLVFFYLAVFLQSVLANQSEAEIQDNTPSEVRATTLSLLGFTSNIVLIPIGLVFGWLTQEVSVFAAYGVLAAIGTLYLLNWLFKSRNIIKQIF